jgi:hypothetical protein
MGQFLFDPPSVAGWDQGPAWLSSGSMRFRFISATTLLYDPPLAVATGSTPTDLDATGHLNRALDAVGQPYISPGGRKALAGLAGQFLAGATPQQRQNRADACQWALRQLLLSGPDAQLH